MNTIMRAIRSVLRAMRRAAAAMVRVTVWIGGQAVSMLVPAPMPVYDELDGDDVAAANDNIPAAPSENAGIRDLAYASLTGTRPTAVQLGSVTALQADWIAVMDAEMCRRVLKASDSEINAHVKGIRPIRGVLWCDAEAVEDYETAMVIEAARMERDLALDQPLQPKRPGGMG